MADLAPLVPFILSWEGGFVNDKRDPGGATNMGVTLGTLKKYRAAKGMPAPSVATLQNLTREEWEDILRARYWDVVRGGAFECQSVANMVCDFAWHSGPATAGIQLQKLLCEKFGVSVQLDGVIGKETLAAVHSLPAADFFRALKFHRDRYLVAVVARRPSSKKFLKGWQRRVDAIGFGTLTPNGGKTYRV